jgi:hypothetical protein
MALNTLNVYQKAFGRGADQQGLDYWKDYSNGKTDEDVFNAMINSGRTNGENINLNYDTYAELTSPVPTGGNTYKPAAGLFEYTSNNQLSNPATFNVANTPYNNINFNTGSLTPAQTNIRDLSMANSGNVAQYFNPTQLRNDIYGGIKAATNEAYDKGLSGLNNTMNNLGLFRSGLTAQNMSNLEGERMDALAKGWGDTAYNVANLQNQSAIAQAGFDSTANLANAAAKNNALMANTGYRQDANITRYTTAAQQAAAQAQLNQSTDLANMQKNFDMSKYSADIQNAWNEKNFDALISAKAQDQSTINEAAQYNIQVQTVYDQLAYDYMKSVLQVDMTDRKALMDYINNMTNVVMQSSDTASKDNWLADLPGLLNVASNGLSAAYGAKDNWLANLPGLLNVADYGTGV